MEHMAYVDIIKKDGTKEEVEVYFELDDYYKCVEPDDKMDFITEETEKQYKDIKEICFVEKDLTNLEREIDDINDTSDILPDETYEEYMEHENLDD